MLSDELKYLFYFLIFFIIFMLSINIFLRYTQPIEKNISCSEFEKILENCKNYENNYREIFLTEQCKDYLPGKYRIIYINGKCLVIK